ncbi:MAG: sensor histidine kinase [Phycisphaerae bacterium]
MSQSPLEPDSAGARSVCSDSRLTKDASLDKLWGSVFESLPSCLVVFDKGLNIVFQNAASQALLPDTQNIADALTRLTVDGTYIDWTSELRRVIQSAHPRRFDARMPHERDQPETTLDILISPLRLKARAELIGGILLAEDVSARISMERRLAISERLAAVGKLAARVAHELNNPLDGILRYTNLAIRLDKTTEDPRLDQYLENVRSGLVRMAQIVRSLLEFSRSTPGAVEQATINKIVEDALTAMEGRIRDADITVICNFHQADMPVIRGSSLFQIFCNLIKNAVDAMPDGGSLAITTQIVGSEVVATFEDTGSGLPADIDSIFEPFFTTKSQGRGTGLGLAVCRELIDRYGGTVTAARREPVGTIMTVRIPEHTCSIPPE